MVQLKSNICEGNRQNVGLTKIGHIYIKRNKSVTKLQGFDESKKNVFIAF